MNNNKNILPKNDILQRLDQTIIDLRCIGQDSSPIADVKPTSLNSFWGSISILSGIGFFLFSNPYAISTFLSGLNLIFMNIGSINVKPQIHKLQEFRKELTEIENETDIEKRFVEFIENADFIVEHHLEMKLNHLFENTLLAFAPAFYIGGSHGLLSGNLEGAIHLPINILIGAWLIFRGRQYRKQMSQHFTTQAIKENFDDIILINPKKGYTPQQAMPQDFSAR